MKVQLTNRNIESTDATIRSRKQSPFLQLAEARTQQRAIRIAMPLRRRESCVTKRAKLAALRDAEFAEWLSSYRDFLGNMYQPTE
jgi:hypothetical protein